MVFSESSQFFTYTLQDESEKSHKSGNARKQTVAMNLLQQPPTGNLKIRKRSDHYRKPCFGSSLVIQMEQAQFVTAKGASCEQQKTCSPFGLSQCLCHFVKQLPLDLYDVFDPLCYHVTIRAL